MSSELRRVLAGGIGALAATLIAHFVNVIVGDAIAALIGFALGYWLAVRLDRSIVPDRAQRGLERVANSPPQWIWFARRAAVLAAALVLVLGDRLLFDTGIHGLPRKLGAVMMAVATLLFGTWLTRWPRVLALVLALGFAYGPESPADTQHFQRAASHC